MQGFLRASSRSEIKASDQRVLQLLLIRKSKESFMRERIMFNLFVCVYQHDA